MMYHIPGLFTAGQLDEVRHQLENASWTDGRATTGEQGARVKHNQQVDTATPLYQHLQGQVVAALDASPHFFSAALPRTLSPPLFNRYREGETYGFHVDGAVRSHPSAGWMRTDLSATLFLSAPEEYDGGELVINDTYGQQRVKLPAGDLVLYPASSLHCVTPVTRGERLASFLWIQSMIRHDQQRAMLYELDSTLQTLRARHGESAETLSLLNMYHNLLRSWSEL
ncbi:Fe2+-dependent dioxygenase [Shimwellia blattae]|uniref:PKHD-type hydroxylase n=1 Tax=Shimwellia blattae (strain ATCC 29907 / DSM 4481 / JCM 1650 / NBRC 105725 / CDC 9005-74) TaxID=630626 RepID=I2B5U6_SHIBC|nr:Fe2+-dependent dioxygenase [Shimwellia blattae]AFJ45900.1 PKHD-type hydroxylase [Shimwellia blattae DSM 4481 = NBRC 105725]GAB81660.1 PKHD-type hydroxylase YbiX [Shimwellia blattae DSM 4481 = NBRC 105725]VDY63378.1 PKHD-type hydroxylase Sbal_3634 [Shimwellia blattae]VEC21214.1 PKHD-type hydroxylase Sbal_3634 [Shimwellia blattae]